MAWDIAPAVARNHKIFIYGPPGCWKTRLMLRLGHVPKPEPPALAVLDTEFGTTHYGGEFNFRKEQKADYQEAWNLVKKLIAKPPAGTKAIGIDSYTMWDKALVKHWVDQYKKRLLTSSGHHTDFYLLQPNDHQPINQERDEFIRDLLESGLHVLMIAQVKNEWKGLKVTGKIYDAPERFAHMFDTVLEVFEKGKNILGFQAKVHKDRTNHLQRGKIYDWDSEEQAFELMKPFVLTADTVQDPTMEERRKSASTSNSRQPQAKQSQTQQAAKQDQVNDTTAQTAATADTTSAEESKKPNSNIVEPDINDLLKQVVALKKEIGIQDKDAWLKLVQTIRADAKTAKDFTVEEVQAFISYLNSLRPTPAQGA